MASLKEIKARIASVQSTQKITSAMRMVASAKLHRTQTMTQNFLVYSDALQSITESLGKVQENEAPEMSKSVTLITISSSSGLCGAFNSNIAKETLKKVEQYKAEGIDVTVIPIGKKIAHELKKHEDIKCCYDYLETADHLEKGDAYEYVGKLMGHLQEVFALGETDRVEVLYHHFKSMGSQIIETKVLPMLAPVVSKAALADNVEIPFITEPSPQELVNSLHPKMLNAALYGALLDASASEHAARMMAMQTADDNANELLHELTLVYNKTRQQAITNELIDMMGGKIAG